MAFKRIMVLLWADLLGGYAIWTLQTYLTSVWNLEVTHAADIINVSSGLAKALPLLFVFMVDSFLGHYWMLLFSSIAYTAGLGLLSLSTPPVLAKTTNTCNDYKPECVGRTQKALFYTALAFLVVGISGHIVSLVAFLKAQADENGENRDQTPEEVATPNPFQPVDAMFAYVKERNIHSFRIIVLVLVPTVAIIALPYVNPWSIRFGVPAICSLVATLFFLMGCYQRGGPLTSFFRATEAKFIIRMIPFWVTFIICGIITSLGNTYFVEQAKNMNFKIGKLKLPITILLVMYDSTKRTFTTIYLCVVDYFKLAGLDRYVPAFGIGTAIIFSTLCCITAAKIENKRINVITDHGLLDKPDEKIPMSAFWLVFQFILLAAHDSLADNSISGFFDSEPPESMRKYLLYFTQAVNGLGTIGSVLSVYVVGKVSQKGGHHPNWFQYTLNKSRLDNYYWVLACLSAASFVWYTFFASIYTYRKRC